MSSYKKVQFILVSADTSAIKKTVPSGKTWVGYRGTVGDPVRDAEARVNIIKECLKSAKWASKDPQTLVIFMTPEFFFRPAEGSYPAEATDKLMDLLMEVVFIEDKPNWLYSFGTIIGDVKSSKDQNTFFFFDSSCFFHMYMKKNTSGIDFVKAETADIKHLTIKSIETREYDKEGKLISEEVKDIVTKHMGNVQKRDSDISHDSFFDYKGIKICAETCLDHAANDPTGVARMKCQTSAQPRAQIHLLSSAGMTVEPKSVCAVPGGFMAHTDGLHRDRVTVYQVEGNYGKDEGAKLKNLLDDPTGWFLEEIKNVPWYKDISLWFSPSYDLPAVETAWK